MNIREVTAHMKALAGVVRDHVAKAFSDLSVRIDVVENKINSLPTISEEVIAKHAAALALQAIPPAKDGEPGKDADPALIKQLVDSAVAELPPAKDGEHGKSFTLDDAKPLVDEIAKAAAELIPAPQDGKSVPLEDVQKMVDEAVAKAIGKILLPKNGEPGRDATHIEILPAINEEKSYPRGTYATHLGGLWRSYETTNRLKGWECIVEGVAEINFQKISDRKFNLQVVRSSGNVDQHDAYIPLMIYRGVFSVGEYEPGDVVTWAGAAWHCDEKTSDKPGEIGSKGWTLCVKKGRDGKDGTNGRDLVKGVSLQ